MHWVFAYGSNMHLPDLDRWLRERDLDNIGPLRIERARIPDFELVWNYRSSVRQGGAANASPRTGAELRGLALFVDNTLLSAFDEKEGHPTRYDRGAAPVHTELLGSGAPVVSWLYRVTPAYESTVAVPPRAAYLQLLIEAAEEHDLGADYVQRLREVPTAG